MRAPIEARATEALGGYVGGVEMLKANLRDTIAIAREAETRRAQDKPADGGRRYPRTPFSVRRDTFAHHASAVPLIAS
jgi:hypothetical protein